MADTGSPFYIGHRERLRQKFLDDKLADYEKLELMLAYIIPRRDVKPLAHALLSRFGSISNVLTAPYIDLIAFPGIGRNVAIFLKLIHEIVVTGYRDAMGSQPIFHDINMLINYCKWILSNKQVEEFHVLYLNSDYYLLKDEKHSVGSLTSTAIYVREIVRRALELNSTVVVLVHNHPGAEQPFSSEDVVSTEEMKTLFDGLDIYLYDHILISKCSVYSARTIGFLHD